MLLQGKRERTAHAQFCKQEDTRYCDAGGKLTQASWKVARTGMSENIGVSKPVFSATENGRSSNLHF